MLTSRSQEEARRHRVVTRMVHVLMRVVVGLVAVLLVPVAGMIVFLVLVARVVVPLVLVARVVVPLVLVARVIMLLAPVAGMLLVPMLAVSVPMVVARARVGAFRADLAVSVLVMVVMARVIAFRALRSRRWGSCKTIERYSNRS